jgi:outer membrane lipoprotein-sorting protein
LKHLFLLSILFFSSISVFGQDLLTATAFFDRVAARYGQIDNYTGTLVITSDGSTSQGAVSFLAPNRLRIDFSQPDGQILVSDGRDLQVYIPRFNVVLSQQLRSRGGSDGAMLANQQGLALLRRNYSIAYLDGPGRVPLEEGSSEMVTKLRLNWRNNTEGYRQLILSITDDLLIRRITGVTANFREVQFDFTNLELNPGIPATRFEYRGPSSANTFYGFLFEGEG